MVSAVEPRKARDADARKHVPSHLNVTAQVPPMREPMRPPRKSPFDRESGVAVIGVDLHEASSNLMSRRGVHLNNFKWTKA